MRVPLTIGDFLERAAHVYGDRVAVLDEPEVAGSLGRLTYEELHHRARALAVGLDSMGIGVGERVGIVSPNSARFLASYFGVSGFGRVLVPINYRLTADEIGFIVEHSGARVVLYDPELDGAMSASGEPSGSGWTGSTTPSCSMPRSAARPTRPAGHPTRTRPARSTTRRGPRRGPRACSSPIATAG